MLFSMSAALRGAQSLMKVAFRYAPGLGSSDSDLEIAVKDVSVLAILTGRGIY